MNKAFNDMDYHDVREIAALVYILKDIRNVSLDGFINTLENSKVSLNDTIREINSEMRYISQYNRVLEDASESSSTGETLRISKIVGELVISGADANYITESGLELLPWLCDSLATFRQRRMEDKRMWSYIGLSPYMKEGMTAEKFLPFDWEKKKKKEEVTDKDIAIAKALFGKSKK